MLLARAAVCQTARMRPPFLTGATPRVFGHRGAAGLAPENTLPSFALARALGADVFECDVHATRDGTIVVLHDPTLDRTTNGTGPVCTQDWADVVRLDAGYHFSRDGRDFPYRGHGVRIPTLEAVLTAFPDTHFNIEVKQEAPSIVTAVVELIHRIGADDRVLLAAEHHSIMLAIRAATDRIVTGFSTEDVVEFVFREPGDALADYRPAGVALQIPQRVQDRELVTADLVAAAHRCGLEVHVWTVNDREEMERLLDLGADGIISDLPGLARVVVDERRGIKRKA